MAPFAGKLAMKRKPGARTKSGGLSGGGPAQLRDKRAFAPPGVEVRVLPHQSSSTAGRDTAGRTIIQLPVADRVLETLMTFDAEAAELEPEPDEDDGPPVVVELARPKMVQRTRALASGGVD